MAEIKDFRISVEWRRCDCGRYFAYETNIAAYECHGCKQKRIDSLLAEVDKALASNRALRGVITRLKRSKHG
jgi:hypothetical protein